MVMGIQMELGSEMEIAKGMEKGKEMEIEMGRGGGWYCRLLEGVWGMVTTKGGWGHGVELGAC